MKPLIFSLAYLVFLIPTYVLPYFGSNSTVINGIGVASGVGLTPAWWLHLWFLLMLVLIAWARGKKTQMLALPILSFVGGVFDLAPVLSSIPFVPTVFHIVTLILGIKANDNSTEEAASAVSYKVGWVLAGLFSVISVGGMASFGPKPVEKAQAATVEAASPVSVPENKSTSELAPTVQASAPSVNSADNPSAPQKIAESTNSKASEPVVRKAVPRRSAETEAKKTEVAKDQGTTVRYMKF